MDPQTSSHHQSSQRSSSRASDELADIERKKLYYLERILKEQEKTNLRLHSILENQKQDSHRMIDLLYHIAYSK